MTQEPENTEAAAESNPLAWFLKDREYPCPRCGYSLKGLTSAKCPECGVGLELSVTPERLPLGAWLTCVIGAAIAAGYFTISTLLALGFWIWGNPAISLGEWLSMSIGAVLTTALTWLVIRSRERIGKWPKRVRVLVATGMGFWPPVAMGLLWVALYLFH